LKLRYELVLQLKESLEVLLLLARGQMLSMVTLLVKNELLL